MDSVDIEVLRTADEVAPERAQGSARHHRENLGLGAAPDRRHGRRARRWTGGGLGVRRLRRGRPRRQGEGEARLVDAARNLHLRGHQRGSDALGTSLRRHAAARHGAAQRGERHRGASQEDRLAAARAPAARHGKRPGHARARPLAGRARVRRARPLHRARTALAAGPHRCGAAHALSRRNGAHARLPRRRRRPARGVRRRLGPRGGADQSRHAGRCGARTGARRSQRARRADSRPSSTTSRSWKR